MNLLIGAFLAAHGLIHLSFISPAPARTAGGPEWPFETTRSWLVTGLGLDPAAVRAIATALVAISVALLVAAGLATVGWLVPAEWWPILAVAGAATSLVTLVLFFHPWLMLGVAIDMALLWAVIIAGWRP
jgi:hypothetical protein